ncbi:MAG: hypothetical protein ACHQEB_07530 [Chitinophagales bacterium]
MSNENPNSSHWRNKLEDLEHVPGETYNKNAAWDKLHERLRGKQSSKKILWYWVAAACLLFVLMIAFINYYKGGSKRSNNETATQHSKKTDSLISVANEENRDININTAPPLKDKIVTITKKPDKKDQHTVSVQSISHARFNDTVSIHLQDPAIKALQIVDATSTAATALPSKKKLDVVHINELGDPVPITPDMVHNINKHSFKIKLANEEVFAGPSIVSKTAGLRF